MREKGFATIFGLCLILVIALIVKGIQESEMNHANETTDYQAEFDLQNAAESGIYMVAKKVKANPNILPFDRDYPPSKFTRKNCQIKVIHKTMSSSSGLITLDVWAERLLIKPYEVTNYTSNIAKLSGETKKVYTLFSKAEIDSNRTGGKIYRRAFAYVEFDDNGNSDTTIHFMDTVTRSFTYKN